MSHKSRPTLKTIAKLTGFAVPTVSRALSGASDIGQTTRETIRRVADEIGYVPNRAGLRLRTGRSYVIAMVVSAEMDILNISVRLTYAAATALRSTDYHLNITTYFADEDPVRIVHRIVETGAADAVILNQTQAEDPRVRYLMDRQFPFATHGRTIWRKEHAYYEFSNLAFGELAAKNLIQRGRKNLYLLAPPQDQNYAGEMIKGAQKAAADAGVGFELISSANSDEQGERISEVICQLFEGDQTIDGLICASANSCIAAVRGLEKAGKTIGQELDVFSKETIEILNAFRPAVLTLYEDSWAAGDFLARAALDRIENPDKPPMQFLEAPD